MFRRLQLLLVVVAVSCNASVESPAPNPAPPSSVRGLDPSAPSTPGTVRNMKGFEVHHWREGDSDRWALLPGTNRSKAVKEIEDAAVPTLDALQVQLRELAPGQSIILAPPPVHPDRCPLSKEAVERLRRLCAERELELVL